MVLIIIPVQHRGAHEIAATGLQQMKVRMQETLQPGVFFGADAGDADEFSFQPFVVLAGANECRDTTIGCSLVF